MCKMSKVAYLRLPTFGDYGPIKFTIPRDGFKAEIYPTPENTYLVEGKKDDSYGAYDLCVYTRRSQTPGGALDGITTSYTNIYDNYTYLSGTYQIDITIYMRTEKRSLCTTIVSDGPHEGWHLKDELHTIYRSPGRALNTWLEKVLPEPYAEYVHARGTLGEL